MINKMRLFGLILALGTLLNCGGSGNNAPVIFDLTVSQTEFDHNEGGGAATVTVGFGFSDDDGDVETIYILASDTDEILTVPADSDSLTVGTLEGILAVDTSTVGTFTGEFYIKDKQGNESNHLTVDVTVNP